MDAGNDAQTSGAAAENRLATPFESLFLNHNIRLAAAVLLEPNSNKPSDETICRVWRSATWASRMMFRKDLEGWKMSSIGMQNDGIDISRIKVDDAGTDGEQIIKYALEKELSESRAVAPAHLVVLESREFSANRCIGFVVNANHALFDGRSLVLALRALIGCFSALNSSELGSAITSITSNVDVDKFCTPLPRPFLQLSARDDRTGENETELLDPEIADEPYFLPLSGTSLTLEDLAPDVGEPDLLLQQRRRTRPANIFHVVPFEHLNAALKSMKNEATATGIIASALQLGIALQYFTDNRTAKECSCSVSILVDMRPFIKQASTFHLAVGTITVSNCISRAQAMAAQANSSHVALVEVWRQLAIATTHDLHARLARGEHIRQARALANGRWEDGAPSATIELSNLGLFEEPAASKMFFGQRFDAFRGVSVLVHTIKRNQDEHPDTGCGPSCMVLSASVVPGFCADTISTLLSKVKGLFFSIYSN